MKLTHIVFCILFTLCLIGCSNGSSGVAPSDGGDESPDFNQLDIVVEYYFEETIIAQGDDINFIAYATNYSDEDFSGNVDILIEYAIDGSDDLYTLYDDQIDISFDSDDEFQQGFTLPGMAEGDYWFKLTIGTHSENESVMLQIVPDTFDLSVGLSIPVVARYDDANINFAVSNNSLIDFDGDVIVKIYETEDGSSTETLVYDVTHSWIIEAESGRAGSYLPGAFGFIGINTYRVTIECDDDDSSDNNEDIGELLICNNDTLFLTPMLFFNPNPVVVNNTFDFQVYILNDVNELAEDIVNIKIEYSSGGSTGPYTAYAEFNLHIDLVSYELKIVKTFSHDGLSDAGDHWFKYTMTYNKGTTELIKTHTNYVRVEAPAIIAPVGNN